LNKRVYSSMENPVLSAKSNFNGFGGEKPWECWNDGMV
jgi:hypothetical protein